MTILTISDLHGRQCWQQPAQEFVDQQDDDNWQVIFLGDYVDSFCVPAGEQLANLTDVILFKRKYVNNVILLLGNHDIGYLFFNQATGSRFQPSGFQPKMAYAFHALFHDHRHWFQVAWQVKTAKCDYLFTHAGVSSVWLEKCNRIINNHAKLAQAETLADTLNAMLLTSVGQDTLYWVSPANGGYYPCDGPLWIRPRQLGDNGLAGFIQVVGHTPMKKLTRCIITSEDGLLETGIIFCDCLHDGKEAHRNEFLTLTL